MKQNISFLMAIPGAKCLSPSYELKILLKPKFLQVSTPIDLTWVELAQKKTYPYLFLDDTLSFLKNVYVAMENQVVLKMDNFLHVFVHQFWAYYVINMEYLAAVALTQELFQR